MEFLTNNWLFFALAGVMAFFMMKGGGCCGSHAGDEDSQTHGGGCCGGTPHNHNDIENIEQDEINQLDNQTKFVQDPICGMGVNPEET